MADQVKAAKKLEWLEDEPKEKITKGVPFIYRGESFKEKIIKKTSNNILVPLGIIGTIACLTMGLVEFKRGNPIQQQMYMRGRVALQAFSLAAMVLGSYYGTKKK